MMAKTEQYDNDKMSFLGEYNDHKAAYHKNFLICFYPSDNSLDIYDKDLRRMFLRRTRFEDVGFKDMFVGNTLRIYGRQIKIRDFADERTKNIISRLREFTIAVIEPGLNDRLGDIINRIQDVDLSITKMRMCLINQKQALELCEQKKQAHDLPFVLENMMSGPVVGMELVGENAIGKWNDLMGPNDPIEARRTSYNSLRALYGKDSHVNSGFQGSSRPEQAENERQIFFPEDSNRVPRPPEIKNATCCVIKPHAIREGNLGNIIKRITDGHFIISAVQMVYLSSANADVFVEVYKGVVADYNALLNSFLDGPCVALAISCKNPEQHVQKEFRELCGPFDPDIARQIRPHTLRAVFGCDRYRNAVHCTDLEDDTQLEIDFMFNIMYE